MGCCSSSDGESAADNKAIDKHTAQYKETEKRKYKLLLLGAGESGKSTILKQMRVLHGKQYEKSELWAIKPYLNQNVIEAMRTLAIYSDILADQGHETKVGKDNLAIRDRIACMSDKQDFTKEHYDDFKILWNDAHIQKTLEFRNTFQLIDTAEYLFQNMSLYCNPEYIPTFDDLIHCRQRTTGVNKIRFDLRDNDNKIEEIYQIYDVGGQKNERKKWLHFFDNTTAIIFVAAISGYNQLLWEDNKSNRMTEAIGLFNGIVNLSKKNLSNINIKAQSEIILFLNKFDLFESKLLSKADNCNVKGFFPDFDGNEWDKNEVLEYFKKKFKDQRRSQDGNGHKTVIHFHLTIATDTGCIEKIFDSCRVIIIKKELKEAQLL